MSKKYYIYKNPTKDIQKAVNDIHYFSELYDLIEVKDPQDADVIISIGGDGTFLEAAKISVGTPIFGINKGTLGFLTDIKEDKINQALCNFANDNYKIKKRMMLDYYFIDKKNQKNVGALNDIVISKRNASIVNVDVFVDDVLITGYSADGVIVSTPTGSTGYSLSCGGPIVDPTSEMIIITPISPHTLVNRSICVSAKSKIALCLNNSKGDDIATLSVDGVNDDMEIGQTIVIRKANKYTNMVVFDENSFLEKIKSKMR